MSGQRIYVASSWRNKYLDAVVKGLRDDGHTVYDFRKNGFGWSQAFYEAGFVPQNVEFTVSAAEWEKVAHTPMADAGFRGDMKALTDAEALVLVLPAGRSAHLEAGFACAHRPVYIYQPELERPDLMMRMVERNGGKVFSELDELRFELLPDNPADKAIECAARDVERSELPTEIKARIAAAIRARKSRLP